MKISILIVLQLCLVVTFAGIFSSPEDIYGDKFESLNYQAKTHQEKMNQIWTEVAANQTPYGWYSKLTVLSIFLENVKVTFSRYSDIHLPGRKKLTHSVGNVAQAEFVAEKGSPYTGLFQGASDVIMRMAPAKAYNTKAGADDNFIPGLALKFLRTGVPSANVLAMYTVDGQPTWNVFGLDWSNHVPLSRSRTLKLLALKFKQGSSYGQSLGVRTFGEYDQNGKAVDAAKVKIPYRLVFRPTSAVKNMFPDTFSAPMHEQLKKIPAGTTIYDVIALENPNAAPMKIGSLRIKSNFVTSHFGDKHLFFQHGWMESDLELHPEWRQALMSPPTEVSQTVGYYSK